MAATGFTPIQLYRTTTAAAVPVNTNLADGELAINTTDEKLYVKNAAGTVVLLASTAGASGDVTLNGSQTLTNKTIDIDSNTLTGVQPSLVSGTNIKTVNGNSLLGSGNLDTASVFVLTYDNRATLRSTDGPATIVYAVESLGLFTWTAGSTELDDDETCFATATGRWLLTAASFEVVDAYTAASFEVVDAYTDARFVALEARSTALEARPLILSGSLNTTLTSVGALSTAAFTVTVTGAAIGDQVVVSPSLALNARLSFYGRVSATDTVEININNASASSAALSNPTTWYVAVIKSI
jgi:hypothetical protein